MGGRQGYIIRFGHIHNEPMSSGDFSLFGQLYTFVGALYVEGIGIRNQKWYIGYSILIIESQSNSSSSIGNVSFVCGVVLFATLPAFNFFTVPIVLKIGSMEKKNDETSLSLTFCEHQKEREKVVSGNP